ncbi:transcription antitermination factor NusB [Psychrobacter frigidicola]|uniref:Transcription antitermination protein NusB n=1 Tax=Psychrobacter frigidicola TaxID=45611 RepID=A0A5C6ZYY7_9GAMM|nr:transcription antitermination factor NusB [Psychrobacter frigidicola]TXD96257.1 transcription antitermination factor NusB [Psychrobacter frigidicola]
MTDQLKRAISAAKTAQSNSEQAEAISVASSSAGEQHFDMSESSYKTSHTAVRKARRFAMQGLYEWLMTDRRFDTTGKLGWKDNTPHDIAARTRATNAMHTVHIGYYHEMMRDIPEQIDTLDALINQHLDREIDKLDTVEHAILLIGAYELQNRLEIPYKVVLDEAMKLNNHFGATDAHKLINAVLDRMAIELREVEVQADIKGNLRTSQKAAVKQATAPAAQAEMTTDSDNDSKPTASTKPRISASKTAVKRNRPNKANAGTSTAKAAAENSIKAQAESAKPVPTDKVEDVINASVAAINSDDVAVNNEAVIDEAIDNLNADNENTDSLVDEKNINESAANEKTADDNVVVSVEPSITNSDLSSAEVPKTEVANTKTEDSEVHSAAIDDSNSKSND